MFILEEVIKLSLDPKLVDEYIDACNEYVKFMKEYIKSAQDNRFERPTLGTKISEMSDKLKSIQSRIAREINGTNNNPDL